MTSFSSRTMQASDWLGIKHFTPAEFAAPSAMGREFVAWLDQVREVAGVSMRITSSYRTPEHNADVGGAQYSAHCDAPCNAVDIWPTTDGDRFRILKAALDCGCVRWGIYADGSIHLDRTEDIRPAPVCWHVVAHPARP